MRILRAKDYRRMPWKNGAGETLEVAVAPAGVSLDDFIWRVSMAKVTESGPFSSFADIDRTLAVLEGEMILHVEDRPDIAMSVLARPYRFPGDVPTSATVVQPVTDLNIMTRRGACSAALDRITASPSFKADHETLLVFQGHSRLESGQTLRRNDALCLEAGESVAFSVSPPFMWTIRFFPS